MKKILMIMNPNSGTKKANKILTDILLLFNKYGYDTLVCMTTKTGDAAEYVKKYHLSVDVIVCVGGDGTLNQVVSSMVDNKCTIPLGYIPTGSTNDFATGMKINKNVIDAANDIMTGDVRYIDVGKFNDRYFCYIASCGLFTKVSYNTSQEFKNLFGHLAYVLEGIKDLASVKSRHLKIEFDDKIIEDDYIFAAICNSTSVGGVLTINPDFVNLNDGLFELLLVKMPKNLIEMNSVIIALNSMDYSNDLITFNSVSSAKIYSLDDNDWSIDGEYMKGCKHIEMTAISDAIKIIVPRD